MAKFRGTFRRTEFVTIEVEAPDNNTAHLMARGLIWDMERGINHEYDNAQVTHRSTENFTTGGWEKLHD